MAIEFRKWAWQINTEIPEPRKREGIPLERIGLHRAGDGGRAGPAHRALGHTLQFSLDSYLATWFWPLSNPPELLAERWKVKEKSTGLGQLLLLCYRERLAI